VGRLRGVTDTSMGCDEGEKECVLHGRQARSNGQLHGWPENDRDVESAVFSRPA
jgi:hypothetical protein